MPRGRRARATSTASAGLSCHPRWRSLLTTNLTNGALHPTPHSGNPKARPPLPQALGSGDESERSWPSSVRASSAPGPPDGESDGQQEPDHTELWQQARPDSCKLGDTTRNPHEGTQHDSPALMQLPGRPAPRTPAQADRAAAVTRHHDTSTSGSCGTPC